jgi:hypothetical protein
MEIKMDFAFIYENVNTFVGFGGFNFIYIEENVELLHFEMMGFSVMQESVL